MKRFGAEFKRGVSVFTLWFFACFSGVAGWWVFPDDRVSYTRY